jgi:hypothetical protein
MGPSNGPQTQYIFLEADSNDFIYVDAVGIANDYRLDYEGDGVRVLYLVQTGYGSHPASYPMGTGGKAAGA